MSYDLHPDAADEHQRQVSYYEEKQKGLGKRYHAAFRKAVEAACNGPQRYKIDWPPDIRRVQFTAFPFDLVYREQRGIVQVLAIAHHRREPGYWLYRR